ncbi:MAG: porin [Methylobacterium frigidaeris]
MRRLLGSVACLTVAGAAKGADLPGPDAAPVDYVRTCTAHGNSFFYIPGTDTCLRISGRARFQGSYLQVYYRGNSNNGGDIIGYQGQGRFAFDARTQTDYGLLRSFVRYDIGYGTGPYLALGAARFVGLNVVAQAADTFNRGNATVGVDKAFIQFAGFTAGRAASFYDFYARDFELIGLSLTSDVAATNLLAYSAKIGNGFSATLSIEDPLYRHTPMFGNGTTTNVFSQYVAFVPGRGNFAPVLGTNAAGEPIVADIDMAKRSRMPDFVGALRYDGEWGAAQVSAAVHELNVGLANGTRAIAGVSTAGAVAPRPSNEYAWAVQAGVKVNLPFIAKGDSIYLQGAYSQGAVRYTGYSNPFPWLSNNPVSAGAGVNTWMSNAVLDPLTGKLDPSTSWTVVSSLLHYWVPEWRSAFFGSYGEVSFGKASRANVGLVSSLLGGPINLPSPANPAFAFSGILRDTNLTTVGASLIWSPVRDLDIGFEAVYARIATAEGSVVDTNKAPGQVATGVNAAGQPVNAAGAVLPTRSVGDTIQLRLRIQRDF